MAMTLMKDVNKGEDEENEAHDAILNIMKSGVDADFTLLNDL